MQTSRIFAELSLPPDAAGDDPRLDSPSFQRNGLPIVDALAPRLAQATADVLEIGSGSGQHAALLAGAFPQLAFWPSDPNPRHRASIDAWRMHLGAANLRPAIDLDVRVEDWTRHAADAPAAFHAILCANVIHIAPWSVAEGLFRGAASRLSPGGFLALYGPFRWHGRHVSDSNLAFDESLRTRDPDWGVRDVDDLDPLATTLGLMRVASAAMPANNHLLFYAREQQ